MQETGLSHFRYLVKGATLYIGGDVATKAIAFFLIPIYTRYLTPADYGIIEVVKTLASVLTIVCAMGLNGAMTRYYFDYPDSAQRARFLGTNSLLLMMNTFVIVLLIDRFGEGLFERVFTGIPFSPYFRLTIWTIFLSIFSTVVLVVYRVREEPAKYVGFQLCQSVVGFGLIIYFVVGQHGGALGKIEGEFFAAIAVGVMAVIVARPYVRLSASGAVVMRSLRFGLPLVPHLLFWWVLDLSDRLFLKHYGKLAEVGIYSLGYTVASVMVVIVVGFNNAWAPYFFSTSMQPGARQLFASILTQCLGAFLFIGLTFSLFAHEIVILIATPQYFSAHRVIPVVVAGHIFMGVATILGNLVFYGKTSYYMPILSALAAVLNIALNLFLIPRFGMMGAAYATLIAMVCYCLMMFIVSQAVYPIGFEMRKIAWIFLVYSILLTAGLGIQLEPRLISVAVKVLFSLGFAAFLWGTGIVRFDKWTVFGRGNARRE